MNDEGLKLNVLETKKVEPGMTDRALEQEKPGTLVVVEDHGKEWLLRTEDGVLRQTDGGGKRSGNGSAPEIVQLRSVALTQYSYDSEGLSFPRVESQASIEQTNRYRESGATVVRDVSSRGEITDMDHGIFALGYCTKSTPGTSGGSERTRRNLYVKQNLKERGFILEIEVNEGQPGSYVLTKPAGEWGGGTPGWWEQADGEQTRVTVDSQGRVIKTEKRQIPGMLVRDQSIIYISGNFIDRLDDWRTSTIELGQQFYDATIKPGVQKLMSELGSLPNASVVTQPESIDLKMPDYKRLNFNEIPVEVPSTTAFVAPQIAVQLV